MQQFLATRGASAATMALKAQGTQPAVITNGTVAGSGFTAAADGTNGGHTLTFTAPSSNADLWDFSCSVFSQQVQ